MYLSLSLTLQVGVVPERPRVQFTKFKPAAGVAVRTTVVPCMNFAEHALPQFNARSVPFGVAVTVPLPPRPIESVKIWVKLAVTLFSPLITKVHVN